MENKFAKLERLAVANSAENAVHQEQEYGEDEDEEEALSFCDLPLDHLSRKCKEEEEEERIPLRATEAQEDFHFCYLSKDSEMCDANEVFFRGQILPFRHSLSSDKGLFQYHRSISNSESIGGSSSITLFSSRSSRSSSISSSHRSYSSRSSAVTTPRWRKLPSQPQNHFHSRRSSPPRTNFPSPGIIRTNNGICSKKTSSVWNILRLGILVTSPPEIAFQDLKTRCPPIPNTNSKNFRSRNCTIRSIGSSNKIISDTQKRKPRGFLGGCTCSNDAVDTVRSRVASIKKSASETEKQANVAQPSELPKQQAEKKLGTHYRTFEWLKQLSLEDTAEET